MKLPKRLTLEYINAGFCVRCGEQADGVEPDACGYVCDSCGSPSVYGSLFVCGSHKKEVRDGSR